MRDWQNLSLNQCADVLDSLRVPVSEELRSVAHGATPYYGANGLQGHITGHLFDEPLILIAEDGGYFEEFSSRPIAYRISGKSWVNNHAHILRPKDGFDFDFLFYSLEHKNIVAFIKGGTRAKLNQAELREIEVAMPVSITTQRKIAHVLTSIDTAIEKTEALIEKYQHIKAGLMHDLFTRGVLSNGQLRPPREQAPELYQETAIGWIPKEWRASTCGQSCVIDSGITLGPHRRPQKRAHPYLRVANVYRDELRLDDVATLELLPGEEAMALRKFDLLVVEGHANRAEIGRCAMVHDDAEGLLFQNHLFRIRATGLNPVYALLWMNSYYSQSYWERACATSSGLNTINRRMLKAMPFLVPSDAEQDQIAAAAQTAKDRIAKTLCQFEKLRQQKIGLMQDLLTGKVPVKVPESATEPAHA